MACAASQSSRDLPAQTQPEQACQPDDCFHWTSEFTCPAITCGCSLGVMRTRVWIVVLFAAEMAHAQGSFEAMVSYVGTTSDHITPINSTEPGTVGWTFQPLTDISVTALGAFTYNLPSQSTDVGLWNSAGALLASVVFTSSSTLVNQSRYIAITPLLLAANQTYYLGEYSPSGTIQSVAIDPNEPAGSDGYAIMGPDIQLEAAAYGSPAFGFPTVTEGAPGSAIIAPNFQFQPVPEPAVSGLAGAGLTGLLALRRKRAA